MLTKCPDQHITPDGTATADDTATTSNHEENDRDNVEQDRGGLSAATPAAPVQAPISPFDDNRVFVGVPVLRQRSDRR